MSDGISWARELDKAKAEFTCKDNPLLGINAQKFDQGKAPMELLSPIALEGTAQVLAFGAKKYAANNWRKGMPWSKVFGSIFRHAFAMLRGEDLDPESGLPHVDHLGCEVMFLQEYYRTCKNLDDRYKPETKE